ncbi:SDR family oxidoreductase [Christiangramia sp.]|uniref:SDR family NAD(P)-dependent oxidoreductase n=1 Tax=Christiangramia sp. TaxID=1931228 RepID=UPI00262A25E8|nr:SDR family oxidoreductase [Christiangramia sp.]
MKSNERTVLITGMTSGIGRALAHEFAKNAYAVIGVARNEEKLKEVSSELQNTYGVDVFTISKDLSRDTAEEVYQEVKGMNKKVDILVNDAGIGQRGNFSEVAYEKYEDLINLNIKSLTKLTHLFLGDMIQRDEGKILQLGSIAGFQPGPLLAVYHASKAYVVSLSEALATELEDMGSNVTVTCLCPGPTDTAFFSRADMEETNVVANKDKLMAPPEEVAEGAYKALMDGERIYIPGAANKVMTFIRRAIPKSLQSKMQKKFYETNEEKA